MIRKIRILIALTVVAAAATIYALTRPVADGGVATSLRLCRKEHKPPRPPHHDDIVTMLRQQHYSEARRLIAASQRQTADSVEYYQLEALLAKYYFATSQADSLMLSTDRLHRFLQLQTDTSSEHYRQLLMYEQTQRAVCEVKMRGRMDSALTHYLQAKRLADRLTGYNDERLVLLTNLADVYRQQGRYDRCADYFHQAMDLADSLGTDTATAIVVSIGIATAYTAMADYEQSARWWLRADSLRPLMTPNDLFQYLNNRGNDYFLQDKYRESLALFRSLDSLTQQHDDMLWERMFGQANLSHILIRLQRRDEARRLLSDTQDFFTRQRQPLVLYYLDTQRIEMALDEGRPDEARRIAAQSPTPSWMIPDQVLMRQQVLMRLARQTGQWQQLAHLMEQHQQLHDSIMGDKMRMQFSVVLLRHDHQRTMLLKQKQLEEKELSFRWAVALLIAASLVILLLVIISMQLRKQQLLREQAMHSRIVQLRMETVRNRITPHFMSNALTTEVLRQMDGREVDLDALVQLLQRGIEMTGAGQTTLSDELQFVAFFVAVERRTLGDDIELHTDLQPDVDPTQVVLPPMFVQILVENALKHGLRRKPHSNGQSRCVTVRASRRDGGTLVEVIDNGVGLPADGQPAFRTGLKVVQQTIQLLNEQNTRQMAFTLENRSKAGDDSGCRATLFLPDDYRYTLNA